MNWTRGLAFWGMVCATAALSGACGESQDHPKALESGGAGGAGGSAGSGAVDGSSDAPDDVPADVVAEETSIDAGQCFPDGGPDGGVFKVHCCSGRKDLTETDIDCGGNDCMACGPGKACKVATDCTTNCVGDVCAEPTCTDGKQNGTESDEDCGASCPTKCASGKKCNNGADCASALCDSTSGLCVDGNCNDNQQNGSETGEDCGGTCPTKCPDGTGCKVGGDCDSKVCDPQSLVCKAPTCSDGAQNGNETDRDCGGTCTAKCADGRACATGVDCSSGVCSGNPLACTTATCFDAVRNGGESDIDCGGPCARDCNRGEKCGNSSDCVTANCAGSPAICQCPLGMVIAPTLGGGTYCIDKYEASYASYTAFRQANPVTGNQIPECSWNTTYTPPANFPPVQGTESWPVRNVDWCDAYAYCKWAGKRLCGKIAGGTVPPAQFTDANESQWYSACSAQGSNAYPYGNAVDRTKCVISDPSDGGVTSIPPLSTTRDPNRCQGGEVGLFDMSGNLAEWEDSCTGASDGADNCRVRGGGYSDTAAAAGCNNATIHRRDSTADDIGVRCCLD